MTLAAWMRRRSAAGSCRRRYQSGHSLVWSRSARVEQTGGATVLTCRLGQGKVDIAINLRSAASNPLTW